MARHRRASGATNEATTAARLSLFGDSADMAGSSGVTARPSATTPAPMSVPPARTAATLRRPRTTEGTAAARAHAPNTEATALARLRK